MANRTPEKQKDFREIIKEDSKIQIERLHGEKMIRAMSGGVGYAPVVESPSKQRALPGFIEDNPKEVIDNGTFKKVPLLTGVTRDETANGIDLKNIEKVFASATQFLNSIASSLKIGGLVTDIVDGLLPGLSKKFHTFIFAQQYHLIWHHFVHQRIPCH